MIELKEAIEDFTNKFINHRKLHDKKEQKYFLDYQHISQKQNFKLSLKTHISARVPIDIFRRAANRVIMLVRFEGGSDNFITKLIR